MCGRYALAAPPDELVEAFDLPASDFTWLPRYNIAPGQAVPVIAEDARGRRAGLLEWGFVPNWQDVPGKGHTNARAETVATKATFREAFARRRCLIPANGFYEWSDRVPHWIYPRAGGLLSFAGIWERWSRPGAAPRFTMAILTTDANDDVRAVHHRMPLVIGAADRDSWLRRDADLAKLKPLLVPAPTGTLASRAVNSRVNRPAEDDAGLIEAVEGSS